MILEQSGGGRETESQNLEGKLPQNIVREIREELLMSKAELARKAGVSPLTIDRIERGKNCRMETRRKIILALGYNLSDKDKIFEED
ncbi:MAG: helix-turn-helix transcriptional regulator [Deltaproteobacteria bacterium]|nr:helix-turn-helix transcriptional regulator [Deltaproteobacteria bacterium]